MFCFDFAINSKYVILLYFESNQKLSKKRGKKSANIWELEGEQEIFRDDKDVIGFKME